MQKFDTPAPVTAVLDVPAGRIRIIASDRTDTAVEVLPANAARSRDVKAAAQTQVGCAGGVLRIAAAPAANRLLVPSGSVEVTVHLPAGSHIEAKTAAAELHTVGRLGAVTIEGARATVELDEAIGARLALHAGDISIARLAGSAEIATGEGDIRIAEALHGEVVLRTASGAVSIGAAAGVCAALNAGTAYGRIRNTLKNTDGAAGLTIHATTYRGDITARTL